MDGDAWGPISWSLRRVGGICWDVERGSGEMDSHRCVALADVRLAVRHLAAGGNGGPGGETVNAMMIRRDLRWILMNP